jgi:hypothetical protein
LAGCVESGRRRRRRWWRGTNKGEVEEEEKEEEERERAREEMGDGGLWWSPPKCHVPFSPLTPPLPSLVNRVIPSAHARPQRPSLR